MYIHLTSLIQRGFLCYLHLLRHLSYPCSLHCEAVRRSENSVEQCVVNRLYFTKVIMYFYKRILYIIVFVASLTFLSTLIIYFNGMSNFEYSIGVPTNLELKFLPPFLNPTNKNTVTTSASNDVKGIHPGLSPPLSETRTKDHMQNRLERVKTLCQNFHLGIYSWPNGTNDLNMKDPPTPLYSNFFFNREYNLAWCPVYKAGSTTWLHNMMLLKGFSEDNIKNPPTKLSSWARDVYGDGEPGKEFDAAIKLLVVRHPFERIVSGYRDKLSNSSMDHYYYEKYGKKIVEKFRTDKSIKQVEPTFEEFVRYLIKTKLVYYADDHWLPASLGCTPCRVNYDYIAKVESYMNDQEYIIAAMNLTGIIKPRWQHRSNDINGGERSAVRHYFSQISRTQIYSLYRQYYLDFELFGYSYKEYLTFGKP